MSELLTNLARVLRDDDPSAPEHVVMIRAERRATAFGTHRPVTDLEAADAVRRRRAQRVQETADRLHAEAEAKQRAELDRAYAELEGQDLGDVPGENRNRRARAVRLARERRPDLYAEELGADALHERAVAIVAKERPWLWPDAPLNSKPRATKTKARQKPKATQTRRVAHPKAPRPVGASGVSANILAGAWLLREDVLSRLSAAQPTAEDRKSFAVLAGARAASQAPQCLTVLGSTADIDVSGVLTPRPDLWAWLIGAANTTYADLCAAIAQVEADASVTRVRVHVDSPGGSASGLYETMDAFARLRETKSVRVVAGSAHSAAYGIAAVAGPIEAKSDASMFGSVGVAASVWMPRGVLELTNSESPDKRPNLKTEAGRAILVRELDALFDVFANRIATGRGVDRSTLAEAFGRGASFTAAEAKRRGMIDSYPKAARAR